MLLRRKKGLTFGGAANGWWRRSRKTHVHRRTVRWPDLKTKTEPKIYRNYSGQRRVNKILICLTTLSPADATLLQKVMFFGNVAMCPEPDDLEPWT